MREFSSCHRYEGPELFFCGETWQCTNNSGIKSVPFAQCFGQSPLTPAHAFHWHQHPARREALALSTTARLTARIRATPPHIYQRRWHIFIWPSTEAIRHAAMSLRATEALCLVWEARRVVGAVGPIRVVAWRGKRANDEMRMEEERRQRQEDRMQHYCNS